MQGVENLLRILLKEATHTPQLLCLGILTLPLITSSQIAWQD